MTLLRQPGAPMPCPPLFPAAATTVTPSATALRTADERDENDASQLDDVPPLSAGDVLRLMLMTFAPLLIAIVFRRLFARLTRRRYCLGLCPLGIVRWELLPWLQC